MDSHDFKRIKKENVDLKQNRTLSVSQTLKNLTEFEKESFDNSMNKKNYIIIS